MKVLGLNNREYSLKLNKTPRGNCSSLHKRAAELLEQLFPFDRVYHEIFLPDCGLYIDLFLPAVRLAVEVMGNQHFEHTPHFHKTKADFLKAQKRDRDKKEWCILNNIDLIELRWDEVDDWERQIQER